MNQLLFNNYIHQAQQLLQKGIPHFHIHSDLVDDHFESSHHLLCLYNANAHTQYWCQKGVDCRMDWSMHLMVTALHTAVAVVVYIWNVLGPLDCELVSILVFIIFFIFFRISWKCASVCNGIGVCASGFCCSLYFFLYSVLPFYSIYSVALFLSLAHTHTHTAMHSHTVFLISRSSPFVFLSHPLTAL